MDTNTVHALQASMKEGHVSGSKGTGVGISNVERRLRLYYQLESSGLDIQSELGKGTTIIFEIPNRFGGHTKRENNTNRG
jgi:two-component system, sensor histidine kinase YesM